METLYLCTHGDGRVVLSRILEGHGANDMNVFPQCDLEGRNAWQIARDRVEDRLYEHHAGYGFYQPGTFKKAKEQ